MELLLFCHGGDKGSNSLSKHVDARCLVVNAEQQKILKVQRRNEVRNWIV